MANLNQSLGVVRIYQQDFTVTLESMRQVEEFARQELIFADRLYSVMSNARDINDEFMSTVPPLRKGPYAFSNAVAYFIANKMEMASQLIHEAIFAYENFESIASKSELGVQIEAQLIAGSYLPIVNAINEARAQAKNVSVPYPIDLSKTNAVARRIDKIEDQADKLQSNILNLGGVASQFQTIANELPSLQGQIADLSQQVIEFSKKLELEAQNIKDSVLTGEALKKPIEFWKEINAQNERKRSDSLSQFLWASGALGAVVMAGAPFVLWFFAPRNAVGDRMIAGVHAYFFDLVLVGLPIFLCIWVLRTIHRRYSVSLSIANDANERVTMMQTYLALLAGKHFVNESDLHLALEALFRPSGEHGREEVPTSFVQDLVTQVTRALNGK